MRVIAGHLGGRQFDSPKSTKTHPMSDKMRGALFNTLGDIEGLTVLDAFAGSGALSFEAVSRGAGQVMTIESDQMAQKVIAQNIQLLNIHDQVKLVKASANSWLGTTNTVFDVILCDPPYDDLQPKLLIKLAERLKPAGVLVLSLPSHAEVGLTASYTRLAVKAYGDGQLVFFKYHVGKG